MTSERAVLVLLVVLAVAGGWVAAWHRDEAVIRERARAQAAELRAAGFQKASTTATEKLGSQLERMKRELQALRDSGAQPIGAMVVATESVPVEIPCDPSDPAEIGVSARHEAVVGATDAGEIFTAGRIDVTLEGRDWTETVVLPADEVTSSVEVTEDLRDALGAWRNRPAKISLRPRRPKHWRAGWTVGAGICQSDQVDACVAVIWGAQF